MPKGSSTEYNHASLLNYEREISVNDTICNIFRVLNYKTPLLSLFIVTSLVT